ncbi:MAG: hypothetical protein IJJ33_18105 [Victivallales bacterium]|nr:hypothetical protein [Victivallales bacterium]MBQ6473907.1 hypothetical protein [Victivallales bacterium]
MKTLPIALACLAICLGLFAVEPMIVSAGRGTPVVDGNLADEAWRNSIAYGPFLLLSSNSFAQQQTTVRFLWDDQNLYAAFECQEGALDPIQNRLHDFKNNYQGADNDAVYSTDMVQLLLGNPFNGRLYDVIATASGVVCDCVSDLTAADYWRDRDRSWQSGTTAAVAVVSRHPEAYWAVELALPWRTLGGKPSAGDHWKFLAARREYASKEVSSLQAIAEGGVHTPKNLGELVFVDSVPSIQVLAFPAFLPGRNVLRVTGENDVPVRLACKVDFGAGAITAENYGSEVEFELEQDGNFVFQWIVAQDDNVYYCSSVYHFEVNTRILSAQLKDGVLSLNGVAVPAEGIPLKAGVNELALTTGADAAVSLSAGGVSIPWPEGWVADADGVWRRKLLCVQSLVWPNWHVNGINLNRGGLQQILWCPQGIPDKKVSDYTMTFELPPGVELIGTSGYYKLFPVEVERLGTVTRNGVEFTQYAITVKKALSYAATRKSHEMIATVIHVDEDIATNETCLYYYASSHEANAMELPNRLPAHVIAPARAPQSERLIIELWTSWLKSMDDDALRHRIFDYFAEAGVTEITSPVGDYQRLRGVALFNFETWNFNCQEYLADHPEQAQVEYSGAISKTTVCSTRLVREPEFARFLRERLPSWHQRFGNCGHIDWDYESHVKDSYLSCYCPVCLKDFATFAGISPAGLSAERINQEFLPQWQRYCHRRVADFATLLAETIHEELPNVVFSMYSGYQSDRSKLVYGIDWSLLEGVLDLAMCGYGRSPRELHDTQQCFQKTGLVLGELLYPFDYVARTAPQALQSATLLRRCCDATRGCLIYHYPTLDGRSFLAIAEVARIISKYEDFFTTGLRSAELLTMHSTGVKDDEYEVLGDGQGNFLVLLMNLQDKPREFNFEITMPAGRQLFDERGRNVGDNQIPVVLDGFQIQAYEIRSSQKNTQP